MRYYWSACLIGHKKNKKEKKKFRKLTVNFEINRNENVKF